jgi:DNA-binding GntR family transcriptional regulator
MVLHPGLAVDAAALPRLRITAEAWGRPAIFERIVLPAALFPGLDEKRDLPNTPYTLYARNYGITIGRAEWRRAKTHASLS